MIGESVIAGAMLGMMMASIFVALGAMAILPYLDPNSPRIQSMTAGGSTGRILAVVVALYLVWAAVGALTGLLNAALDRAVPGGGLGSPNLVFTSALLCLSVLLTVPAALVFRRSAPAIGAIGAAFAGLFGWALPYFAG